MQTRKLGAHAAGAGDANLIERGGVSTLSGIKVPGTFNYRLPLVPRRWSRMLEALQPDLIEAGDAFHPAWCAVKVAARRPVPVVAFFHSHLPRLVGTRCGSLLGRGAGRYLRWLYDRFDLVLAPSHIMCEYLRDLGLKRVALQPLGVDVEIFNPARHDAGLRRELGLAPAPGCSPMRVVSRREEHSRAADAFERLGDPYHLR